MGEPLMEGLRGIEVDLRGLREFADKVRGEVDASIRPTGDGIAIEHSTGVPFGATVYSLSEPVRAACAEYALSLAAGREALESYLESAEVLLAGALAVAKRYGDTDALAAATVQDVEATLAAAQEELRRARQSPGRDSGGAVFQ